jgi:MFS family permease
LCSSAVDFPVTKTPLNHKEIFRMSNVPTVPPEAAQTSIPERYSVLSSLRHRDFRLLWLGQMVSVTGSRMQFVAVNWHVYLLTHSAFALGMIGFFRGAPIIACSLLGGVVADVVDRRRLMIATQCLLLLTSGLLAFATIAGLRSVWPIYLLTAIASAAFAFDTPARQALLPALVPREDFPNAVSLSVLLFQIAMIVGPALAGFLLASHGPALVYGINGASFLAVIAALALMRASGRPNEGESATTSLSLFALLEGLRFVRRTPIIVQTMTLDFVATFFASATALLPIFADKILSVGARGFGVLAAAPAGGAIIAGIIIARLGTLKKQGMVVLGSVAIFGAATVAFGLSRAFWFSVLALGLSGAADTVSTILRQTIRQLTTPNHLRGRMTSINMIFFTGGPQLGEVEAGAVAALLGAPLSVVTGGVGCLLAVGVALFAARSLRRWQG